jgi:chromosome partitioning protein
MRDYMSTLTIGIISQKGGVGKSTLVRAVATEFARNEYKVLIADMDTSQTTVTTWGADRLRNGVEPRVYAEPFSKVDDLQRHRANYDLAVIDGAPASNRQTIEIADISDYLVLPTKVTLDDLRPQIKLAHELVKRGVSRKKLGFVLSMVGKSTAEIEGAKQYIEEAGYECLGFIPQKDSIGQAHDTGRSALETPFASVNKAVDKVVEAINNQLRKK